MAHRRTWTAVGGAMVVGAALRLVPWSDVFGHGVRLVMDGDPWYHVLRAQELARIGRIPWTDATINAPFGAEIPWPPLFDVLLVAAGWLAGGGGASDAAILRAAAVVPVVLGVAVVALLAALAARALGPGVAGVAALCAAAFGWHVDIGLVGRPDQHVAEILALAALLLLWVAAVGAPAPAVRRRRAVAAGVVLALAFWTWLGSALFVVLLAAIASAWHVAAPGEAPERAGAQDALLWAAGTAGVLLLGSVAWLGPEGALGRGGLAGMSLLPAALCLVLAAIAAALRGLAQRRPGASRVARTLEVVAVGAGGLVLLFAVPPLRVGLVQGLTALGRANPWYGHIREFQPVVGSGFSPIAAELRSALALLGLLPLAGVVGAAAVPWLVRERPERRFGAFTVLAGFAVFLPLAVVQLRFGPYLGVFAVPLAALAARWAVARLRLAGWMAAVPAALVVLSVAPCAAAALSARRTVPVLDASLALARVAGERSRATVPPRLETVLGSWSAGHHLRYGSGLGVIATPFGTEGGPGALEDGLGWFVARSEAEAAALEARRRVRWIVLSDPIPEVALGAAVLGLSPAERPARLVRDIREGTGIELGAAIEETVSVRLFYGDGARSRAAEALARYRLVDEAYDPLGRPLAKLFEVVTGARVLVSGAEPGAPVVLRLDGIVNGARPFRFEAAAVAGAEGRAELVVPYATGRGGALEVRAAHVSAGRAAVPLEIPERAVASGAAIAVALPPARLP